MLTQPWRCGLKALAEQAKKNPMDDKILPKNSLNRHVESKSKTTFLKVAVTGSAGSGKTTVCNRLKTLGMKVISSDMLAREAVVPGSRAYRKIVEYFGENILKNDGTLNRQLLRDIIIKDKIARSALERFVHPEITRLIRQHMSDSRRDGCTIFFVEVPLLFETGMEKQFDVVVMVSADQPVRVQRLMNRDNVSKREAEALLRVQKPDREKIQHSDFIIKNDGSPEQLILNVDRFFKKFCQKYQKSYKSA